MLDLQTELARVDDKKERLEIALSHRGLEAEQKDCIIKDQSKKLAAYKKAIEELQKNQHKTLPNLHVKYIHAEKVFKENDLTLCIRKYSYIFDYSQICKNCNIGVSTLINAKWDVKMAIYAG